MAEMRPRHWRAVDRPPIITQNSIAPIWRTARTYTSFVDELFLIEASKEPSIDLHFKLLAKNTLNSPMILCPNVPGAGPASHATQLGIVEAKSRTLQGNENSSRSSHLPNTLRNYYYRCHQGEGPKGEERPPVNFRERNACHIRPFENEKSCYIRG